MGLGTQNISTSEHGSWSFIRRLRSLWAYLLTLAVGLWFAPTSSASVSYDFTYEGRITDTTGKPFQGTFALQIDFFHDEQGGDPVLTVIDGLDAVPLSVGGMFQVTVSLTSDEFAKVFPDVSQTVYVAFTDLSHSASQPLPRQRVMMLPYAGKVPVDGKTVRFGADGRLTVGPRTRPKAGEFLTMDGNGQFAWAVPWTTVGTSAGGGSPFNVDLASGRVGIGTTSPLAKLTVTGSTLVNADNSALVTDFGGSRLGFVKQYGSAPVIASGAATDITFATSNVANLLDSNIGDQTLTPRMMITRGGNVGIGTTAPSATLDVNGSLKADSILRSADRFVLKMPNIGSGAWYKLGNWTSTMAGARAEIVLHAAAGYGSGAIAEQGITHIQMSMGNRTSGPNIVGNFWAEGGSPAVSAIKAQKAASCANGAACASWDIFALVAPYNGPDNFAEVKVGPYSAWTSSMTADTDPGAASSTVADFPNALTIPTGNVGIGTTNPGSRLQISGGAAIGYSSATTSPTNGLLVNGNVGIGTTNPSTKLTTIGSIFVSAENSAIVADLGESRLGFVKKYGLHPMIAAGASTAITFAHSDKTNLLWSDIGTQTLTPRMTISTTGNVGIGTTTLLAKLSIGGGNILLGDGSSDHSSTTSYYVGRQQYASYSANSGFSGIELGAPSAASEGYLAFHTHDYGVSSGERMRIDKSGNVGIGTTSPSEKLHVVGNLRVEGTTDCTLGAGSGATNCTSDIRLKDNVAPIAESLDKIAKLRGVEFDWNALALSPGTHSIGVIAQDVEAVFPTAVITSPDTGYKMVDYAVLVAPLIEAVKALKTENQALKAKGQATEAKLDATEAKLDATEAKLDALLSVLCLDKPSAPYCKIEFSP